MIRHPRSSFTTSIRLSLACVVLCLCATGVAPLAQDGGRFPGAGEIPGESEKDSEKENGGEKPGKREPSKSQAEVWAALVALDESLRRKAIARHWLRYWAPGNTRVEVWRDELNPPKLTREPQKEDRFPPWAMLRAAALLRTNDSPEKNLNEFVGKALLQKLDGDSTPDWPWLSAMAILVDAVHHSSIAEDHHQQRATQFTRDFVKSTKVNLDDLPERDDLRAARLLHMTIVHVVVARMEGDKHLHVRGLLKALNDPSGIEMRFPLTPIIKARNGRSSTVASSQRKYLTNFLLMTAYSLAHSHFAESAGSSQLTRALERHFELLRGQLRKDNRLYQLSALGHEGLQPFLRMWEWTPSCPRDVSRAIPDNTGAVPGLDQITVPFQRDFGICHALGWQGLHLDGRTHEWSDHGPKHQGLLPTAMLAFGEAGGLLTPPQASDAKESESNGTNAASTAIQRADALVSDYARTAHLGRDLKSRVEDSLERAGKALSKLVMQENYRSRRWGEHMMVMLAMLHAGVPRTDPGMKRALELFDERYRPRVVNSVDVYDAAVALMALQKYYEAEQRDAGMLAAKDQKSWKKAAKAIQKEIDVDHRQFISRVVRVFTKTYRNLGFNYYGPTQKNNGTRRIGGTGHSDNSLAQYAALGLKAASLLGEEVDQDVFQGEAKRWIRVAYELSDHPEFDPTTILEQHEDERKERTRSRNKKVHPATWDYWGLPRGTSSRGVSGHLSSIANMRNLTPGAVSSLVICADELRLQEKLKSSLSEDIHATAAAALLGLRIDYPFRACMHHSVFSFENGWGSMYGLYGVERACILADVQKLGHIEWYPEGAEILLDMQDHNDQLWGNTVDSCMAILFLRAQAIPTQTRRRSITSGGGRPRGPVKEEQGKEE